MNLTAAIKQTKFITKIWNWVDLCYENQSVLALKRYRNACGSVSLLWNKAMFIMTGLFLTICNPAGI